MSGDGNQQLNSWKAPGQDRICGYWWKTFYQLAELLRQVMWHMLEGDANSIPAWLAKGRTVLIFKEDVRVGRSSIARLLALTLSIKLLTAVMTNIVQVHHDVPMPPSRTVENLQRTP